LLCSEIRKCLVRQIQGDRTILSRGCAIFLAKNTGAGKHERSAKVCPQRFDDLFVSRWIMERPFRRQLIARLHRYQQKRRKPIFQLLRKERFEIVPAGDHDDARRVVEKNVEMLQQAKTNPRACQDRIVKLAVFDRPIAILQRFDHP
jgi:hypothetical protein